MQICNCFSIGLSLLATEQVLPCKGGGKQKASRFLLCPPLCRESWKKALWMDSLSGNLEELLCVI